MRTGDREQAAAVINHEKNIEIWRRKKAPEAGGCATGDGGDMGFGIVWIFFLNFCSGLRIFFKIYP